MTLLSGAISFIKKSKIILILKTKHHYTIKNKYQCLFLMLNMQPLSWN